MQRKQKRNIQIATFLVLCSVFHGVLVIKIGAPSPSAPQGHQGKRGHRGRKEEGTPGVARFSWRSPTMVPWHCEWIPSSEVEDWGGPRDMTQEIICQGVMCEVDLV